jgi:hypothetical protein
MTIKRSWFSGEFNEAMRRALIATYDILAQARLLTPDIQEHLSRVVISGKDMPMDAAGVSHCRRKTIGLNRRFFKRHPELLVGTLVHETCHHIDFRINGKEDHGPGWQRLMMMCGRRPDAVTHIGGR